MLIQRPHEKVYRAAHLACGIGGGALGFRQAEAKIGHVRARFETAGAIDYDAAALTEFERITGTPGTLMDLFNREQYVAYHGHEPPEGWREATPDDVRAVFGPNLNAVFSSPPCRGLTSLLAPEHRDTPRYRALNGLTTRCYWLVLEAYKDDPVDLLLLENVPGLATKGRDLLNEIQALLRHYGYVWAESVHDCGELGGLAQHRKRFLMVARHTEKVPPFLYKPKHTPMQSIGDVIGQLPLPGDPAAGPLHAIPSLHFKTWVRLAFVEPGSDWRSLQKLEAKDGYLTQWGLAPIGGKPGRIVDPTPTGRPHNEVLGVRRWDAASGTVAGGSRPQNGTYAVADPRYDRTANFATLGVHGWQDTSGAVTGNTCPTNGRFAVADPRAGGADVPCYAIVPIGEGDPVIDPRPHGGRGGRGKYRVTGMNEAAGTVISSSTTGEGAFAVADDRFGPAAGEARPLPPMSKPTVVRIVSRDGSYHRPYTVGELACLQSLTTPRDMIENGFTFATRNSEQARVFIGNAVPPAAAKAVGTVLLEVLVMADLGIDFQLSSDEIWCRPLAIGLSVDQEAPGSAHDIERRMG